MKKLIVVFMFTFSPCFLTAQWEQTNGPFGGTPRCFAVDGSNVIMGTGYDGGLYTSTNRGVSWNRLYNSLSEYDIYSLNITGSSLFAGTHFGIYKSTNFGISWTFSGLSNQSIWTFASSGNNIFAGTGSSGIYLSTNNGGSWTSVNNGISNLDVRTIFFSGTIVYAGTYGGGVFRSTNNGNNWSSINNGITNLTVITSAISGSNVFVGTTGNLGGVFKSTNNGINWTLSNNGLLNTNLSALTIHQGNIFAGTEGGGLYKSTNNGLNWVYSNSGLTSSDIWSFSTSGNYLIAGGFDAGGCFYSTNNGNNWFSANNGLLNQNVTSIEVLNSQIFAGTNNDGVFKSTNNGFSWENSDNGLPNGGVKCLCASGLNLYAGINGLGGIYKSVNNGLNWSISNTGLTNQTVLKLFKAGSNIFAGTYGGGLFKSSNEGVVWTSANNGITNNIVWDLTSSGINIFCATENGIFRSTNEGTTWNAFNNGLTNLDVRSLTTSGSNVIAGTYGSGIFLSSNNGVNWSLAHAGIRYVWSFNSSGSNVYAGTWVGMYWSTNSGLTWSNYNQSFPTKVINSVLVANNYVFAGTQGSSVWRRSLTGTVASINYPTPYVKLISGEQSTIAWSGSIWNTVNIKCTLNVGTSQQSINTLVTNYPNTSQEYLWNIPDTILSYKSKIVIENASNPSQKIESGIFRIKPYILTRVNPDSTYYEYRKNRDQWGFWNDSTQIFPHIWYQQFDYQGIDPFTGSQYSQWQGTGAFARAKSKEFPDWVSWVNTFTINKCYWSTLLKWYKKSAILKWEAIRDTNWNGSCFGISISNALSFQNKNEFLAKYSSFPPFTQPISVTSTDPVKRVVNELQTHWFGEPHQSHTRSVMNKTPSQTLDDIKKMLLLDNDSVRTLYIRNNDTTGKGAHEIVAYKLAGIANQSSAYNIHVYDVSYPQSLNTIELNTASNGGNGSWYFANWPNWGGDSGIYLEDPVETYLINPTFLGSSIQKSPFILDDSLLQIYNPVNATILIKDQNGRATGYFNGNIHTNIPGSSPILVPNGSEIPPHGYNLLTDSYSVELSNLQDTINAYFFTGNKSFSFGRYDAIPSQTDKLNFDDGLFVSNPDPEVKTISLLNIQDETSYEKLYVFSSLEMAQNDSVKIENLGSDNFKLISYGSTKSYDIELNYASQSELGRFVNVNIDLPSNTSHTFLPDWNNVTTSQLVILEDIGNNGTIDDTLRINNIITNLEEGILSMPDRYSLAQNYPNPFNPSTLIKYNIKSDGLVTLKVYDVLGKEVVSLVNELKQSGRYEVKFNGSNLGSGIYYYRLQAGEYSETKKMLLLK